MPTATLQLADFTPRDKERFWANVNKDGPLPDQSVPHYAGLGPCWTWIGVTLKKGKYGIFSWRGNQTTAHRAALVISGVSLESGKQSLHRCDNRTCVNPAHLFPGTIADNIADKVAKGRHSHGDTHWGRLHPELAKQCEEHGRAKLTNAQALEIRGLCRSGRFRRREVAAMFGVAQSTVSRIAVGSHWKRLDQVVSVIPAA